MPVTGSLAKGCARRATLPFGTRNAVSVILSGTKIRSWKNCPSGHAAHRLDHAAEHVGGEAVLPGRAGLMGERHPRDPLDLLGRGDRVPGHPFLGVRLLHPGVARVRPVDEPGGVAEQVLDRHLALGRHQRVGHLAGLGVEAGDAHLERLELREVPGDGIVEQDAPVLHQHHDRDRGERLGHRVEAEDRVLRHGRAALRIALAQRLEVGDLAPPRHQRDRAGIAALGDLALDHLGDARQLRRGEADLLRCRGGQPLRPGRAGEQQDEQGDERDGSLHRSGLLARGSSAACLRRTGTGTSGSS